MSFFALTEVPHMNISPFLCILVAHILILQTIGPFPDSALVFATLVGCLQINLIPRKSMLWIVCFAIDVALQAASRITCMNNHNQFETVWKALNHCFCIGYLTHDLAILLGILN